MQDFKMIQRYLIATILLGLILRAKTFSYKDAKNWGKKYSKCNGQKQSPVLLNVTNSDLSPAISKGLQLKDFDQLAKKMTLKNTGHTVEIKCVWSGEPPRVTGGPLNGTYVFEKTTFHWAQKRWSEDVAKDRKSKSKSLKDMEMHIFFYRKDLKSFEKAESQKGGLVIIKAWMKSESKYSDHFFDGLEKGLSKVQSINSTTTIPPFCVTNIVNTESGSFLFYEGSLDYPPCSESVTWLIFDNDCRIPKNLINGFRKIKLAEGDVSNVRPLQQLNKREPKWVLPDDF